jgi:hypothetical protein
MAESVEIRTLNDGDPETISAAFKGIGAGKPVAQYRRYLAQQLAGTRACLVATLDRQFAGYVIVNWAPTYCAFVEQRIPEIQVECAAGFRRKGLATRLMDRQKKKFRGVRGLPGLALAYTLAATKHKGCTQSGATCPMVAVLPTATAMWKRAHRRCWMTDAVPANPLIGIMWRREPFACIP